MRARELKEKYLSFFKNKGHVIIPSASLIPENDPTVLFTTAGMQPLVPYLLGEIHPAGKRLVDVQKCLRTDDIDEVGDTTHDTFFEMLGNWSLGDYWKEESISWSYEFLIKDLNLDPKRIWVTCFEGDKDAPRDEESAGIWQKVGIPASRIFFYPKKDNWWGPAGETGPCGPDTEIFYDATAVSHSSACRPGDDCGRFFEIWNNVFMQYNKTKNGKYEPLAQKNVDTGMGVERTSAVLSGYDDNYKVNDLWGEILEKVGGISKKKYEGNEKHFRIIADHIRASVFLASEGIEPSNKERGYVLRRLIRRAVLHSRNLEVSENFTKKIAEVVIKTYKDSYTELENNKDQIYQEIDDEETKFRKTISEGINALKKIYSRAIGVDPENLPPGVRIENNIMRVSGYEVFKIYETYGLPPEISQELMTNWGVAFDQDTMKECEEAIKKHQELSRTASAGMFKGGLSDKSEEVAKLHTATHLLHAALRKILGEHVSQKGSNITAERLRFDFSHPQKLTDEELKKVESLMNEQIDKDLPVSYETKSLDDAIAEGALHFFAERYGDNVKVYTIGDTKGRAASARSYGESRWFSKEVCGGPHVSSTGVIGRVKIFKQEKVGSGIVRIYVATDSSKLKTKNSKL